MKKILLSVFAVAALASCFQNEDIVSTSDSNAIKFDSYVGNTTKAIDPSLTKATLHSFQVWGNTQGDHTIVNGTAAIVPIFTNVNVNDNSGSWAYAAEYTQYWIDGNTYNFAAVVNGAVTKLENNLPKEISYTADDLEDQLDLLYDEVKGVTRDTNGDSVVDFTFDHLLSKAVFTFENTTDTPADPTKPQVIYTVSNIQIAGLSSSGVYTVGAGWGTTNTSLTEAFGHIVAESANAKVDTPANIVEETTGKSNYERLLIPGTYNATVTCTINLYLNGKVDKDNLADVINYSYTFDNGLELKPGYSYNFSLSAGLNDQILFNVTEVNGWTENYPTFDQPNHDNN